MNSPHPMTTEEALTIVLDLAHRALRGEVGTISERERIQNAFTLVHNLKNTILANAALRREERK